MLSEVKERAGRNRTIYLTPDQERTYLDKCIHENKMLSNAQIIDQIILGDCFNVLSKLPKNSVDLLIVDPPYNLDKTFR